MHLERNIGVTDRIVRTTLAAGFIAVYASGKVKGVLGIGLMMISGIFLVTSAVGYCPAYQAVGIDSLEQENK